MTNSETEYTVQEAARIVRVDPETIRRAIRAGKLPARKAWMGYRIKHADLLVYANRREGYDDDYDRRWSE